jgi:hypothetical protein
MKKVFISLSVVLISLNLIAQAPQGIKYQAVIRDNGGNLIISKNVGLRISLIKDNISGTSAYTETHIVQSNQFGIVNLSVGTGIPVLNTFATIDWSTGNYFIKIEIDPNGGTSYISVGDPVQLLSVPFALYSNRTNTRGKFEINGTNQELPDSALFVVKDKNGNVVFAVYEGGAELNVNPSAKGAKGGFVVGGRTTVKGSVIDNIMTITPDSVRFYIDNSLTKGSKGGFVVGGRNATKGIHPQYLNVTQDSSRIYTTDTIAGFGVGSLKGITTSSYMHINPFNYFIGQNSGQNVIIGSPGVDSGKYNATLGFQTGMNITSGMRNVFIGYQSGYANTTGFSNTSIGNLALFSNINGKYNAVLGESALYSNTTGNNNSALGTGALEYNTTGNYNAAVGTWALTYNTTGIGNVAFGNGALYYNDTASYNTAIGAVALHDNKNGWYLTALGNSSLRHNTSGSYITAVGNNSLNNNINGDELTAIGQSALFSNISGSQNTALGAYALGNSLSGNANTANGYGALNSQTSGTGNSALGGWALYTNKTGSYNTAIGQSADVASSALNNATAIGYNAIVNSSNKVVIGNSSVTSIGGFAAWANYSDKRLKENIQYKSNLGLDFINKLHTVSFSYKADNSQRRRDGLIAQDVQEALTELGLSFSGLVVDSDSAKTLNLSYGDFVIPLINAVQDLSRQNEELLKRNEEERNKNIELANDVKEIKEMLNQKAKGPK